ncbi:MAG: hypothetical protein LBT31_07435 [Synergistaceae bacterium]|jgi:Tfp pilus tip-associated adhesin PilY1|nr:hypothetical protein [Synergistaceae bacterium]
MLRKSSNIRAKRGTFAFRKLAATLTLSAFISGALAPLQAAAAAGLDDLKLRAPLKRDLAFEETDETTGGERKANVLFLIESTAAMGFTPKGVVPQVWRDNRWDDSYWESANWEDTRNKLGYTIHDINRMMEDATFGMGALPTAWRNGDLRPERNLYGRDLDSGNNYKKGKNLSEDIALNKDNYYFPFLEAGNALVGLYNGQMTPLEVSFDNAPTLWPDIVAFNKYSSGSDVCSYNHPTGSWSSLKIGYVSDVFNEKARRIKSNSGMRFQGDEVVRYSYWNATMDNKPYPYALVFKDPKYWANGWTENTLPGPNDLVPNDSRMYETKMVLWNLLQNRDVFKGLRFAMATTFLSPANVEIGATEGTHYGYNQPRSDINGMFKVSPYSSNVMTKSYFDADGNSYTEDAGASRSRVRYKNGAMYGPITGELESYFTIHGQFYPMWHNATAHSNYATLQSDNTEPDGWWSNYADGGGGGKKKDKKRQGELADRPQYKLMNRASLHLPFKEYDDKWTKYDKTITHADKFKMWINGIADIKSDGTTGRKEQNISRTHDALKGTNRERQFHYYNDPEIGIAGVFALAQAIFPDPLSFDAQTGQSLNLDREYYLSRGWIWYSLRDANVNYRADFRRYSDEIELSGAPRARYNSGSGEAAGSVLDFFSPLMNYNLDGESDNSEPNLTPLKKVQVWTSKDTSKIKIDDLDDVSFPIRSACEDNWVVVISSGMEPKVANPKMYSYSVWEAVKNLYDSTDASRSRDMNLPTGPRKAPYNQATMIARDALGRRVLKHVDLENPIRTIVIGIVANENDPDVRDNPNVLAEVRRMRLNLVRAAVAGQGGDASKINYNNMSGAAYQPYFADNAASLTAALQSALSFVNESQIRQPGRGSITESVPLDGEDAVSNAFRVTYRIVDGNQWDATLTRFIVSKDAAGGTTMKEGWELGERLLARRGDASSPLKKRNLIYWSADGTKKFVDLAENDSKFGTLVGMTIAKMASDNIQGGTFNGYAPYNALYQWFQGYDYSYAKKTNYPRTSMLVDASQSAVVLVDAPTPVDSLPGFRAWAEETRKKNRHPAKLYLQTNDGILHVVNPGTGDEELAILPPPVLLPSRVATLKTKMEGGALKWMDVEGPEKKTAGFRSNPVYLLDGSLQKKRFDMSKAHDGTGWGTFLLGTLGRGGCGLYMLDVSSPNDLKFSWYREKAGEYLVSMAFSDAEPRVELAKNVTSATDAPYKKLGYNSPKPAMGAAVDAAQGYRNIVALPGGTQTAIDFDANGGEGSTLLLLDAKDGSVIHVFDGTDVAKSANKAGGGISGRAPYMGMMTSEPFLYRSENNQYMTGNIFAADNRGNIFRVSLEEKDSGGVTKPLSAADWSISTVATLQPDLAAAAKSAANYSMPYGLAAGGVKSTIWLAGGTADIPVLKTAQFPEGALRNESQMIFALKAEEAAPTFARDNLKLLSSKDVKSLLNPSEKYMGWYIPLEKSGQNNFREYVSAKPTLVNGTLFVPTFIQKNKVATNDASICGLVREVNGESRLYALDVTTGGANFWGSGVSAGSSAKYIALAGVKITGLTLSKHGKKNSLFLTLDNLSGNFDAKRIGEKKLIGVSGAGDMAEIINLPGIPLIPPFGNGKSVIDYWLIK